MRKVPHGLEQPPKEPEGPAERPDIPDIGPIEIPRKSPEQEPRWPGRIPGTRPRSERIGQVAHG